MTKPSWQPGSLQALLTSQPRTMLALANPTSLKLCLWADPS